MVNFAYILKIIYLCSYFENFNNIRITVTEQMRLREDNPKIESPNFGFSISWQFDSFWSFNWRLFEVRNLIRFV